MNAKQKTTVIFLCILKIVSPNAHWWYLAYSGSEKNAEREISYNTVQKTDEFGRFEQYCSDVKFFSGRQRELCNRAGRNALNILTRSAVLSIKECQHQFGDRRWNCSTSSKDETVFGKILQTKGRETAYIYALSSASVMYAVTRACAAGKLAGCGCDHGIWRRRTRGRFEWGGCSHDVKFGRQFSRDFVDTTERDRTKDNALMNLWNNEAGRRTITGSMRVVCKCHGVSGACSLRICWRVMAPFGRIGYALKEKFEGSSLVRLNKNKMRLRPFHSWQKRPTKRDLVYLELSPDYCEYDPRWGSLGTQGRPCNNTSLATFGCGVMCCGRGFRTETIVEIKDCKCKFFWCCRVECKRCKRRIEKHHCK